MGRMKPLFETVVGYLQSKGLRYSRTEDCSAIVVCYRLNNASVNCTVTVNEDSRYLSFCTRSGIMVPAHRHGDVVEFIARANLGLNVGALLFDHKDGDVSFKTSLFAGDSEVPSGVLRLLLSQSINTYDLLHPGLVDVIYRDVDSVSALQNVRITRRPRRSQEEIDTVVAKLMAGLEEPQACNGFDAILARAGACSDGILLPMKELVSASGQHRAGKHVVRRIEESLQVYGLGHEPAALPRSRSGIVRVFKRESAG
jgi:hypothetical protein